MKKRVLWIAGAVVVIGGVAGGVALRNREDKLPEVETAKVERRNIVQKVSATGRIQPKSQVKISADVSAKIIKLAVKEGEWVEQGTLLVELDRERYVASVESAEASVRSAQANANLVRQNMNKTEKEFTRSQELLSKNLESQSAYDAVHAAYQVELARYASVQDQVAQAEAALKQARDDLAKTTIYAPMAGTISDLNKEQGEIAIGSQFQEDVIMVISDLSQMEAQVNVDENDIVSVAIGQEAEIEADALLGKPLKGVVYEIANSANVDAQGTSSQKTEFEVKVSILEPVEALRPGMTASAEISTKSNPNALSVPIQSVAVRTVDQLTREGEEAKDIADQFTADKDGFVEIVFCIEGGKAIAREVKTGIQSDDRIEILEGLTEGEEIVTGSYRAISKDLINGSAVAVTKTAEGPDEVQAAQR
jgi:HlyD family secretion protein